MTAGEETPRPPPPPGKPNSGCEDWELVRWTPNGTKVPRGPPPEVQEVSQMPEWPFEMYEKVKMDEAMKWLGQPTPPVAELRHGGHGGGMDSRRPHKECGGGTRSRHGDCDGGTRSRSGERAMTAMEARTMWLEREMSLLKQAMERGMRSQPRLQSEYWQQAVWREERPLGQGPR